MRPRSGAAAAPVTSRGCSCRRIDNCNIPAPLPSGVLIALVSAVRRYPTHTPPPFARRHADDRQPLPAALLRHLRRPQAGLPRLLAHGREPLVGEVELGGRARGVAALAKVQNNTLSDTRLTYFGASSKPLFAMKTSQVSDLKEFSKSTNT